MTAFDAEQARVALTGSVAGTLLRAQRDGDLLDPIQDVVITKDVTGAYNPWLKVVTKAGHEIVISFVVLSTDAQPA